MYVVVILEAAHEDLRNILAYISSENPNAAEILGRELLDQAMSLESLPYRGSRVKKRRGILKLIQGNYLIYYRIKQQKRAVEIIAFKHGAQIKQVCSAATIISLHKRRGPKRLRWSAACDHPTEQAQVSAIKVEL